MQVWVLYPWPTRDGFLPLPPKGGEGLVSRQKYIWLSVTVLGAGHQQAVPLGHRAPKIATNACYQPDTIGNRFRKPRMLSLRAFTLNLYRPPACPVYSAVRLNRGIAPPIAESLRAGRPAASVSRSRTACWHYGRARQLMRHDPRLHLAQGPRWNAPCDDRIKSEPYRLRQDRERWRHFSDSPANSAANSLPVAVTF
jgi:hypothetical protein